MDVLRKHLHLQGNDTVGTDGPAATQRPTIPPLPTSFDPTNVASNATVPGCGVIRLYRARFSTNVERVALALAHKGLEVESVWIEYADRSLVERVSGQGLVPVVEFDDGTVVSDSMEIVRYVDERYPQARLYPDGGGAARGDAALRRLVQPGVEGGAERDRGRA